MISPNFPIGYTSISTLYNIQLATTFFIPSHKSFTLQQKYKTQERSKSNCIKIHPKKNPFKISIPSKKPCAQSNEPTTPVSAPKQPTSPPASSYDSTGSAPASDTQPRSCSSTFVLPVLPVRRMRGLWRGGRGFRWGGRI